MPEGQVESRRRGSGESRARGSHRADLASVPGTPALFPVALWVCPWCGFSLRLVARRAAVIASFTSSLSLRVSRLHCNVQRKRENTISRTPCRRSRKSFPQEPTASSFMDPTCVAFRTSLLAIYWDDLDPLGPHPWIRRDMHFLGEGEPRTESRMRKDAGRKPTAAFPGLPWNIWLSEPPLLPLHCPPCQGRDQERGPRPPAAGHALAAAGQAG